VEFPPNGSTPPHRHGGASVIAHVIQGTILSKMNDSPAKVYQAGESWYEAPGCHHKIADNHSKNDPAKLLATFVVDTESLKEGYGVLFQPDEGFE